MSQRAASLAFRSAADAAARAAADARSSTAGGPESYRRFLAETSRLAYLGPQPPRLYNTHLVVQSPFHSAPKIDSDTRLNFIKIKSEKHDAAVKAAADLAASSNAIVSAASAASTQRSNTTSQQTGSAQPDTATIASQSQPVDTPNDFVNDIPLPSVIQRHILKPVRHLAEGTSLGKIIGFRIEAKGRRGPRSRRVAIGYGRLDLGETGGLAGSHVDFGKAHYVDKRGTTGVKVWVVYGNN